MWQCEKVSQMVKLNAPYEMSRYQLTLISVCTRSPLIQPEWPRHHFVFGRLHNQLKQLTQYYNTVPGSTLVPLWITKSSQNSHHYFLQSYQAKFPSFSLISIVARYSKSILLCRIGNNLFYSGFSGCMKRLPTDCFIAENPVNS